MAITAPVSLSKIRAEFGGPGRLSAYVRGGAYVPNTPANSAISTTASGLRMSQFLGASATTAVSIAISPTSISHPYLPNGMSWSQNVTATVTGLSGTLTYAWTWIGTEPATPNLTNPNTRTVTIFATGTDRTFLGNLRVTVRSSATTQTYTASIPVHLQFGIPR